MLPRMWQNEVKDEILENMQGQHSWISAQRVDLNIYKRTSGLRGYII